MRIKEKAEIFLGKSALPLTLLTPGIGLFPRALDILGAGYQFPVLVPAGTVAGALILGADQYLKYQRPKRRQIENYAPAGDGRTMKVPPPIPQVEPIKWRGPKEAFNLWGQHFKIEDFMTSIFIVGTSGTGKTSAGFDNLLDSLMRRFTDPDPDSPKAHIGGFFLDVKNQFFVRVLFFLARSGRNPLTDLKLISPYSQKIVAEFEDPETGFRFYMNGSHFPTGTACNQFLRGLKTKNGLKFPENLFSVFDSRYELEMEELKSIDVETEGRPLNLIGWREDGGRLIRVVRNTDLFNVELQLRDGAPLRIKRPKSLRFVKRHLIESGIRYNIIDNNLPASAITQQLMKVADLINGSGGGGENAGFWKGSTESQINNCINLWRIVKGRSTQITGPDILKLTTNSEYLDQFLKELKDKKRALNGELLRCDEDTMRKQEIRDQLELVEAVMDHFTVTWAQKDIKQKNTVEQMIVNLFGIFQSDEHLKRSFCSPATYSFSECMNDGRIFVLVPGADYSDNAKVIGTLLKLHFQKIGLERVDSSTMNKTRTVLFGADEVQRYVVAANAGSGDPDFNNLSRESLIINAVATQTDSSISDIIKGAAASYFSSHGIRLYFNVDDPDTKKRGVELCAQTKKEDKFKRKGDDVDLTDLATGKGQLRSGFETKEKQTFKAEDFNSLKKWETICYNKFAPNYKKPLAVRFQNTPHEYGLDHIKKQTKALVDWYQTAALEQALFEQGETDFLTHDKNVSIRAKAETEDDDQVGEGFKSEPKETGASAKKVMPDEPSEAFTNPPASFDDENHDALDQMEEAYRNEGNEDDSESGSTEKPDSKETTSIESGKPNQTEKEVYVPKIRSRSPVAQRIHKGEPITRGSGAAKFALFAQDAAEPELPATIQVENSSTNDDLEIPPGDATDVNAEQEMDHPKAEDESDTAKLSRVLDDVFNPDELEAFYNESAIAEMFEDFESQQAKFKTPDSITTGHLGLASDMDSEPLEKGLTTFPAKEFDPSKVPDPATLYERSKAARKSVDTNSYNRPNPIEAGEV